MLYSIASSDSDPMSAERMQMARNRSTLPGYSRPLLDFVLLEVSTKGGRAMPGEVKDWKRVIHFIVVIAIISAAVVAAAYADWRAFNQKFPHASFWAWVISPR